jgi:hypothetical protein
MVCLERSVSDEAGKQITQFISEIKEGDFL